MVFFTYVRMVGTLMLCFCVGARMRARVRVCEKYRDNRDTMTLPLNTWPVGWHSNGTVIVKILFIMPKALWWEVKCRPFAIHHFLFLSEAEAMHNQPYPFLFGGAHSLRVHR